MMFWSRSLAGMTASEHQGNEPRKNPGRRTRPCPSMDDSGIRALGDDARKADGCRRAVVAQGVPGHERPCAHATKRVRSNFEDYFASTADRTGRRHRMDDARRSADGARNAFFPAHAASTTFIARISGCRARIEKCRGRLARVECGLLQRRRSVHVGDGSCIGICRRARDRKRTSA